MTDDQVTRPMGTRRPRLEASGLTKAYAELVALHPVDLEVAAGQSVALIGHNGSGKSTLLRIVAGLLEPTRATGRRPGWPVDVQARATTSFLPDEPVLYDDLWVREHVEYVSRLFGGDGFDDYAEEVADRLGLTERLDDLPSRFSRGLRQKASLLLGLARPFSLLLVDEPFVGLDAPGRRPCSSCSTRSTRTAPPWSWPPTTPSSWSGSTAASPCATAR